MAKFNHSEKWRKRTVAVASIALATTFSFGFFAACTENDDDDDDDTSVSATDTQTIKNGNFEFYSEMDEDVADRFDLINSPTSWSFTSGSPSSTVSSGIIDTESSAWANLTRTGGYSFRTYTYSGENSDYQDKEVTTFDSIADAIAHWEDDGVSAYDRLRFYEIYQDDIDDLDDSSTEALFFDDYQYSVDYEDVKYITEVCANGRDFQLHSGVAEGDTNVLMIHNLVTSNSVVGTAQYYTSSTTITLSAGTAAEVSVWVKTNNLYHYAATQTDTTAEDYTQSGVPVSQRAGAYIGVTNTVGGTSLDQMQIKNINTNGEWEQYTVYVRASTYATTTFKLALGLGQGSSSDRYYNVNGYAFFDDVTCNVISAEEYENAVGTIDAPKDGVRICTVNSEKDDKLFDMDVETADTYALDLYAAFDADDALFNGLSVGLTSEKSGSNVYDTDKKFGLGDIEDNFAKLTSLSGIASAADSNRYLKNVYENDLKAKYPFGDDGQIVMLMSANGAAYKASLAELTLDANEQMLVSFFVKTSAIPSGYSGASATVVEVVDGMDINKTSISAFDSTTVATVDIDDDRTDIYDGWVQCFFFIQNSTDSESAFRIELNYGPTTITGTSKTDYCDGYAAFTNFETKSLTKTEYSYASTGSQAVKVSLTGETEETKNFDTVSATAANDIETGLALPSGYTGVLGGSSFVVSGGGDNVLPEKVYAGLLNSQYAKAYYESSDAWKDLFPNGNAANEEDWWVNYFGNARQPLVIAKNDNVSYGYFSSSLTISASSYQKISMRVRVSAGAVAYIYLTDASGADNAGSLIVPNVPNVTYWYNDFGDICKVDPASKDYNSKTDILFELQDNGLYLKKDDANTYYANLYNYDTDDQNNLVTADGTIAYYYNEADEQYYAYYDEEKNVYTQAVVCLPTEDDNGNSIVRYNYTDTDLTQYGSVIKVDNTDGSLTDWITVSFFVATGNESRTYRLEVWNGDRLGTDTGADSGYVIFDNYINEDVSGDYTTLLNEAVSALKKSNSLSDKENLDKAYALYYTFTFYDADFYLRYDVNEDEDELGNPYGSYTQSSYEEQLVYLRVNDKDGSLLNAGSFYGVFLDYTATDVTVTADDLGSDDTTEDDTTTLSDTNIWLLISSGILAVVLLFVIVLVIIQRLRKHYGKKSKKKAKPVKDKRYRPDLRNADKSDESDDSNN